MPKFHAEFGSAELEFRILRLLSRQASVNHTITPGITEIPSTTADVEIPVYCELYHKFHEEKPYYEALSYTWGDPFDTVPISVNDHIHDVTRNLYTALKHIRKETEDVHIWVDALCINQHDDAEKSEQVKKMKDIYADAALTIVWLGLVPSNESMQMALKDLFQTGSVAYESGMLDLLIRIGTLPSDNQAGYQELEQEMKTATANYLEAALQDMPKTQKLLEAYSYFVSQPYWERVWILQEIVISANVLMRMGHLTLPFLHFHALTGYIPFMSSQITSVLYAQLISLISGNPESEQINFLHKQFMDFCGVPMPKAGSRIMGMRRNYQMFVAKDPTAKRPPSLMQLLARVFVDQTPKATQDKDRIYALLGMAVDLGILDIQPDYSPSVTEMDVYTQVAHSIILTGQVDFLAFAQHNGEARKEGPSWVPDWRKDLYRPSGQLPWDTSFNVCGNRPFSIPNDTKNSSLNQIKLSGLVVDKVHILAPTPWTPTIDGVTKEHIAVSTYLSEIITLCNLSADKLATSPPSECFNLLLSDTESAYRIPVADQEEYGIGFIRRATSDAYHGYIAVVEALKLHGHPLQVPLPNFKHGDDDEKKEVAAGRYYNPLGWQRNRHAFMTEKGLVGLGAVGVKEGDLVVVFDGGKFPYVLREMDTDRGGNDGEGTRDEVKYYQLVGEAYVHGIMYGELFAEDGMPVPTLEGKEFTLI